MGQQRILKQKNEFLKIIINMTGAVGQSGEKTSTELILPVTLSPDAGLYELTVSYQTHPQSLSGSILPCQQTKS